MAEPSKPSGPACSGCSGGQCKKTLLAGVYTNNPVLVQVVGICSVMAVTSKLEPALVMGVALMLAGSLSSFFMSLLRNVTPPRIRMIVEISLIAVFVIVFDQTLKALYWDMSRQLGPYVGLIITNCILMGRLEGFALQNKPGLSMLDGFANGLGYALLLAAVGSIRELVGAGTLLGHAVLPNWVPSNLLFLLSPGAFFTLGFLIWIVNAIHPLNPENKS